MIENLDLRLLRYFVMVAEELHFGRAAQRLHIAQPSLSQQIRRLESQLGVVLLNRSSRRVELTNAGQSLLHEGRRTLAQAERALYAARNAGRERMVVGFSGSAASHLLIETLRRFEGEHPSIDVAVREVQLSHTSMLLDKRVDVAFTRLLPGESQLQIKTLYTEARLLAVPDTHPLAGRGAVELGELSREAFITQPESDNPRWRARWLAEQHRHGLSGRIGAEATSIQEILTLVAAGRGVCLIPAGARELYPRPDVAYLDVPGAEPSVISLAWDRELASPATARFIDIAQRIATQGTGRSANESGPGDNRHI